MSIPRHLLHLLFILAAALPSLAEEAVLLKFDPPSGQKVTHRSKMEIKMQMSLPTAQNGAGSDMTIQMETDISQEIKSKLPDGSIEMLQICERASGGTKMGGASMAIPSENFPGKSWTSRIDKDGKLLPSADKRTLPTDANPEQFSKMTNPVSMLPGKPIKPGESWTFNYSLPLNQSGISMTLNIQAKALLKEVREEAGAKIACVTVEFTVPATKNAATASMPTEMTISGTGKGNIDYNLTHNYLQRNDTRLNLDLKLNLDVGGQKVSMDRPLTISIVTELIKPPEDLPAPTDQ
ncbi:MAG: DUF6263 family protein [Verrucomicrobiae bacterium]|nr:DUF6263 family protein [Verrucomicrobiae bacterium]